MMVAGHLLHPAIVSSGIKAFSLASTSRSKESCKPRLLTGQPKLPLFSRSKQRLGHQLERLFFLVNDRAPVSSSAAVSFPLGDFGNEFSTGQESGRKERSGGSKRNEIHLTKTVQESLVDDESKSDEESVVPNDVTVENAGAATEYLSPYGVVSAAVSQDVRFIMSRSLGSVRDEAGIALVGQLNKQVKKLQKRWASGFVRGHSPEPYVVNLCREGTQAEEEGVSLEASVRGKLEFNHVDALPANGVSHGSVGEELAVCGGWEPSTASVSDHGIQFANEMNGNGAAMKERLKAAPNSNGSTATSVEIRKSLGIIMEDLRKSRQDSERLWVQERDDVNTMLDSMWTELDNLQLLLRLLEEEMVMTTASTATDVPSAPTVTNEIGTLPLAALTYPGAVTRLQSTGAPTGGTLRPGDASAVAVPNTGARPLAGPKGPRSPKGTSTHAADGVQKKGSWHEWAAVAGLGAYALAGGVALYAWRAQMTASTRGSPPTPVTAVTTAQSMQTPTRALSPLLREARPGILELNADNFYEMLYRRPTFVMFYAPWCPYCQRLEGTWKDMAVALSEQGYNVQVAQVNAWKYPQFADAFQVPGFPTLILFNGVQVMGVHRGPRDLESLLSFVDLKLV